MIRREGDSLILEGPVTLDTVPGLVGPAEEHLQQGARVVDFRNVTEVAAIEKKWKLSAAPKMSAPEALIVQVPALTVCPPATVGFPMSAQLQPLGQLVVATMTSPEAAVWP